MESVVFLVAIIPNKVRVKGIIAVKSKEIKMGKGYLKLQAR